MRSQVTFFILALITMGQLSLEFSRDRNLDTHEIKDFIVFMCFVKHISMYRFFTVSNYTNSFKSKTL